MRAIIVTLFALEWHNMFVDVVSCALMPELASVRIWAHAATMKRAAGLRLVLGVPMDSPELFHAMGEQALAAICTVTRRLPSPAQLSLRVTLLVDLREVAVGVGGITARGGCGHVRRGGGGVEGGPCERVEVAVGGCGGGLER